MRGRDLVSCDSRTGCPSRCHTCEMLTGHNIGLCCPSSTAECAAYQTSSVTGTSPVGVSRTAPMFSPVRPDVAGPGRGFARMDGGALRPGGISPDLRFGSFGPGFTGRFPPPMMMGEVCYDRRPPVSFCVGPMRMCPLYSRCVPGRTGRAICCAMASPVLPGIARRFPMIR